MGQELYNIHRALDDAMNEKADDGEGVVASFRVPKIIKDNSDLICKHHGITTSKFLRQCLRGLVNDFLPRGSDPIDSKHGKK